MDFLVSVIGNAVVDPIFRRELLKNPADAIDEWGFRLTKGESAMLQTMFHKDLRKELEKQLDVLENILYRKVESPDKLTALGPGVPLLPCPFRKCACSLELPKKFRGMEEAKAAPPKLAKIR